MGRKRKEIDEEEVIVNSENIIASIEKKFGEGLARSAELVLEEKFATIPVSPVINVLLGGGIKEGTLFICSGIAKAGKTTLALHFAGNCQQPENGNRHVYYIDAECRLADRNIKGAKHLDPSRMTVISSAKGNPLTGERILSIIQEIIHSHPGSLIILDSLSSLSTEKEQGESVEETTRNTMPLKIAKFLRQTTPVLRTNKCILFVMQHLIANTSGYGLPFNEDGGNKIQYAADGKIRSTSITKLGDKDNPYGQSVMWQVFYSALGNPGRKLEGYIRYGEGIDTIDELRVLAVPLGLVSGSGAWFYLDYLDEEGKESVKVKGKNGFRQYMIDNPEHRQKLEEAIYQEWLAPPSDDEEIENEG